MIYTIGHRENYLKAIAIHGAIQKSIGGYAFETFEDAARRIREVKKEKEWVVWGLDADWETDTRPDEDGSWWRLLTRTSDIVPLNQNVSSSTPVPEYIYISKQSGRTWSSIYPDDLYEEDVPDTLPEYPETITFSSSDEPSRLDKLSDAFFVSLLILTIFLGIVFVLVRGW